MAEEIVEVVITAPDPAWLAAFADALVRDRLCACGHLQPPIRSIYQWRGEIHDEPEARVALHTRAALVGKIVDRVQAEHPYEVPCVIAMPIVSGNPAYLDWVVAETRSR